MRAKFLLPVTAALTFFLGFEAGGFQFVLSRIAEEFSLSGTAMGWLAAVQYIAIIIMPLLAGGIADHAGKKKVLTSFAAVFIAGCALVLFSGSTAAFMLGIFVVGSGYCICESVSSAALADSHVERAQKNLNLIQCCFSLGAVSGPLLTSLLIEKLHFGWRVVFLVSGGAYLLILPLILCTSFTIPDAQEHTAKGLKKTKPYFSPVLICLFFAILLYVALENGVAYFLDSFFIQELSASSISALSISIFWLSMAGSRLFAGLFTVPCRKLLTISFSGSAVLLLLLGSVQNPLSALLLCSFLGVLFGPVWPTIIALAAQTDSSHSGRITSIMVTGCGIGGALSPAVLGGVLDAAGIRIVFAALALVAAAGTILMLVLKRKRP